jgi:hypothetical protein
LAIEVPRGALVGTLLARGLVVYAINPKQWGHFRDRPFPAGSKDDRRDAYGLVTSLRTELRCFHRIRTDEPVTIRLRGLSRLDDDLRLSFNRHGCPLREQLQRYYPQVLDLSSSAHEPWIWPLLESPPLRKQAQSSPKPAWKSFCNSITSAVWTLNTHWKFCGSQGFNSFREPWRRPANILSCCSLIYAYCTRSASNSVARWTACYSR